MYFKMKAYLVEAGYEGKLFLNNTLAGEAKARCGNALFWARDEFECVRTHRKSFTGLYGEEAKEMLHWGKFTHIKSKNDLVLVSTQLTPENPDQNISYLR